MKYFFDIEQELLDFLNQNNIDIEKLLYCVKSDIDENGDFFDNLIIFDDYNLYRLSYSKIGNEFDNFKLDSYEIEKIQKAYVDRQINSARMIIIINSTEIILARFLIGHTDNFIKFCDRLIKTKNKETTDDTTLDNEIRFCPKCNYRYPEPNQPFCPNCVKKSSILKRLINIYLGYKKQALMVIIGITLTSAFGLVTPFFSTKILYDEVLSSSGRFYKQVALVVIMMVSMKLIGNLIMTLYGIIISRIAPRIVHDLREKTFSSLQKLSLSFFSSKQTGSLMSSVNNDTNYILSFFTDIVPMVLVNSLSLIGLTVVMFVMNTYITLIILAVTLISMLVISNFSKKQKKLVHKFLTSSYNASAYVSDVLNGQRVVKAFSREDEETNRYKKKNKNIYESEKAVLNRDSDVFPKIRGLIRITFSIAFAMGTVFIITGNMTLGILTAIISYANMLVAPVDYFIWLSNWWSSCVDASSRIFAILEAKPTVLENTKSIAKNIKGNITLKNVKFEYDAGRPILDDISFEIKAGEMFGIVGKTGAGKSTIINLILRLYDVTDGEILFDGINVKDLPFKTIRENVAVVSQETYMFMGTVGENIAYAAQKPDALSIIGSAKTAFAHEFISKLQDGYDTIIGSGGHELSGGEKQRISIARAVLQEPQVLIFDEATAAMDTQTERKIQYAIEKIRKDKTVIAIAHRLSTLRDSDTIAVIEKGKLKEIGTHDDLTRNKSTYFELHNLQSESLKFIQQGGEIVSEYALNTQSLDETSSIIIIDNMDIHFKYAENGFLELKQGEKEYSNIVIYRLMPFQYPDKYISVQNEEGEIGIIEDLNNLSKAQKDLLMTELSYRYFTPNIEQIIAVKERMAYLFLTCITEGIQKTICISNPTVNIRTALNCNIIITDVESNRYFISSFDDLDRKSRQYIEAFI